MSKAERTRQFIIEKIAPVFNSKGFAGTSMNDITEVTGLTKGSIYGNFENKDEVAIAAFDYNFSRVTHYIGTRIRENESAIDKLLVYPETHRQILSLPFLKGGCPVLNTSVESDDTHPDLRAKVIAALTLWRSSVEGIIASGIRKGEIKKNTDAASFATILISLTEGAVMQAKVTGRKTELNVTMDFLEKMIHDLKK
jgi:TetR/AcrR family transcriptional regulator, transcriptional repressor for nem operon